MSDEQKFVDQPDYQQLCAAKQRRIDELEGMLEQKYGIVRRGLVKLWHGATWPFRLSLRLIALPFFIVKKLADAFRSNYPSFARAAGVIAPAGLAIGLVAALAHGIYLQEMATRQLVDDAFNGPEYTLQQLAEYQGYYANKTLGDTFADPRGCVTKLTSPDGQKNIYVRVPKEVWSHLSSGPLDVVETAKRMKASAKEAKEYQESLDRIRRGEDGLSSAPESPENK